MDLNDRFTLPLFIRAIPEVADVLQAEQIEIEGLENYISEAEKELCITTCEELIYRYEKLFDVAADESTNLEHRKAKIIAKMLIRAIASKANLEEIAEAISGCRCQITEHNDEYWFEVAVGRESLNAFDLELLKEKLTEFKPAHLGFTLKFAAKLQLGIHLKRRVYRVYLDPCGSGFCGDYPEINFEGRIKTDGIAVLIDNAGYKIGHELCGTYPQINILGNIENVDLPTVNCTAYYAPMEYLDDSYCGEEGD